MKKPVLLKRYSVLFLSLSFLFTFLLFIGMFFPALKPIYLYLFTFLPESVNRIRTHNIWIPLGIFLLYYYILSSAAALIILALKIFFFNEKSQLQNYFVRFCVLPGAFAALRCFFA